MPFDPEIFGPPSSKSDYDIFKDSPVAKSSSTPAPVQAPQISERDLLIQRMNDMNSPVADREKATKALLSNYGWGTGAVKAAYNLGGHVTDLTGSPLLGAIISALPDAAQSAIGGEIGKTAAPVLEVAAKSLMGSALKPTLDQVKRGRAAPAIQTMLDEGLSPTAGGVEKAKGLIDDLGQQVKDAIEKSGSQIDIHSIADYAKQAYARFQNGPMARQAAEDIGNAQKTLLEHPNVEGARTIPVQTAQEMKTGYQRAIGDKGYGELKTPATEADKQIARGFREAIGEAVPSTVEPLSREAAIINAKKMMERRVAVEANKNPIGIGWLGQPWMIPYWLWDRSSAAKALTARALYSGSQVLPGSLGATAGALYGAMQPQGALYQQ